MEEIIPDEWNVAILCWIFKKGDPMKTSDYRGISLLDTDYKVLITQLIEQISPFTTDIVGWYQCGFKKEKSAVDYIHTIRQLTKKYY